MRKSFKKLVRDNIPDIIKKDGLMPSIRKLDPGEYILEVGKKFGEEGNEYAEAETKQERLEELSDLLQLIYDAAEHDKSTISEVEQIRAKKLNERGGFSQGIFLESITD